MGGTSVEYDVLERILARSQDPRDLPLETLKSITEDFSEHREIGNGGFGKVYKGVLPNGIAVAVKRVIVNIHNLDDKLFDREVNSLFKVTDHPNVVRFLGFCHNTNRTVIRVSEDNLFAQIRERLLCFEYISNGSLNEHITDELRGLEWNTRYQIIKGICEGLQYLHKNGIIHMDLKPTNIMVDNHMVPKITDFGVARSDGKSHTTGDRFISLGYSAPEYKNGGSTTVQCDIYSFGAIIQELVTGRKGTLSKNDVLRRWRHRLKSAGNTQLLGQQVTKCIEIAERCMENEPAERPSLETIIANLEKTGNTNAHISAVGQVSPSWWDDDDMMGIDPLELHFALELVNMEISNEVVLINKTGNCIAFNINTESRLQYCIEPKKGIVSQGSNCTVKITLQVQATTTQRSMPRDDKFIVQSTEVNGSLAVDEINEDMFNDNVGKVVDEVILTVVYDDKPVIAQAHDQPPMSMDCKLLGQGCTKRQRVNFRPPPHISTTTNMNDMSLNTWTVSAMTGAMGSLRHKLLELLKEEHNLGTRVKKDIKSLERQLMSMQDGLHKLSRAQEDQVDEKDKEWAKDVRDLSYDIEDIIDDLMVWMEQSEISTSPDLLKERLEVIKDRVKDVCSWHETYKVPDSIVIRTVSSTSATADPRLLDWYKDHKELIGIDGRLSELMEMLEGRDNHNVPKKKLNIISISGEGGLGKTTLAKAVFHKLSGMKFVHKAFVTVGRNPIIEQVLKNILIELDKNTYSKIFKQEWNNKQLIDEIQDVLTNKRYFIVIDDIWDTQSWNWIKCALIDNNNGSRVMTTSRIYNVAANSGEVFMLEPLSDGESKELLYARLNSKGTCTFHQSDEQSTKYILQKCGGIPLAIISIASLLDGKPVDNWLEVYKRIGFGHRDTIAENTKRILLFSYNDLPCHLKTCLLYLSIYPEDHVIEKNRLVWKWVAEGFVRQEKGNTLFEVGESYFNELINRAIIQPAVRESAALSRPFWQPVESGTICGCRIHDMVLDMIRSKAKEENFVTVLDTEEQDLSSQNIARILAIPMNDPEPHDLATLCEKEVVRSFHAISCWDLGQMELDSLLPRLRFLRVLSLEECKTVSGDGEDESLEDSETVYEDHAYLLKNLEGLRHLRCLGLAGTNISKLPRDIGRILTSLQILDLTETNIVELPQSVTLLRELKCLLCNNENPVELPYGMGSLTSLQELHLNLQIIHRSDTLKLDHFIKELRKLRELRVLCVDITGFNDFIDTTAIKDLRYPGSLRKALVDSLNNLKKMEELRIDDIFVSSSDPTALPDYSPTPQLRYLNVGSFKMPAWIKAPSLRSLSYLYLALERLTVSGLGQLGSLTELRCLYLVHQRGWHRVVVVPSGDAFPKLRYLETNFSLTYVPESMKCLQSLEWFQNLSYGHMFHYDGLRYLRSLKNVTARLGNEMNCPVEAEEVMAALRRAVDNHPNCPILELK